MSTVAICLECGFPYRRCRDCYATVCTTCELHTCPVDEYAGDDGYEDMDELVDEDTP